ncbi:MAG: alpha/beta fold hydrolase [Rhodobacteraceae bacterium]|nr:alpha/beta fold hydrolase [Paracoccaceae bacterium]
MTWTTRPRSEFGDLAAIRAGQGPTVLLLHGVGLRAEAWNAQIDALSDNFSVIAPDMAGHGSSSAFPGTPTLRDYADRIAHALTAPLLIAGHSMGAMIALDLAIRYPDLVQGVAALNAIYRRTPDAAQAVRARAAALPLDTVADPSAPIERWFGTTPSAEAEACRTWLTSVSPLGYKAAYTVFAQEDGPSDDGLKTLRAPTLFLTGRLEPNSTPAMSSAMAHLAPHGRTAVIEDAAHMMPMTHPDQTNAHLIRFFQECLS